MPRKTFLKKNDDVIMLDESTTPLPQTPTPSNENSNVLIQHKRGGYCLRSRAIPSHVLYEEIPLITRRTSASLKEPPATPSRKQPERKAKGLVPFKVKGLVEQNTLENRKKDSVGRYFNEYVSSTEKTKNESVQSNVITIESSEDEKNIKLQQENVQPDEENLDPCKDDNECENIEQDERNINPYRKDIEYDEENIEQNINIVPDEMRVDDENIQLDVSAVEDSDDEGPEDVSFSNVKTLALAQLRQEEETAQRKEDEIKRKRKLKHDLFKLQKEIKYKKDMIKFPENALKTVAVTLTEQRKKDQLKMKLIKRKQKTKMLKKGKTDKKTIKQKSIRKLKGRNFVSLSDVKVTDKPISTSAESAHQFMHDRLYVFPSKYKRAPALTVAARRYKSAPALNFKQL